MNAPHKKRNEKIYSWATTTLVVLIIIVSIVVNYIKV